MLGIPPPVGSSPAVGIGWHITLILESWSANLERLDWATMTEPTLSRGRSIRNLTVNTFHPIELLPRAFDRGHFDWYPEDDDERERALTNAADLVRYAHRIQNEWKLFLLAGNDDPGDSRRDVSGPRGTLTYPALLESQRWHAAWHHRQLVDHVARRGIEPASLLGDDLLDQVGLPETIY